MTSRDKLQQIMHAAGQGQKAALTSKMAASRQRELDLKRAAAIVITNGIASLLEQAARRHKAALAIHTWDESFGGAGKKGPAPDLSAREDTIEGLVWTYCLEHHADLDPKVQYICEQDHNNGDYETSIWGIVLSWA